MPENQTPGALQRVRHHAKSNLHCTGPSVLCQANTLVGCALSA